MTDNHGRRKPTRRRHAAFRTILVLCLILLIGGSSVFAGKFATKEKSDSRIEPDDANAAVYFLRTAVAGSAIYTWLFIDEDFLTALRGRSYAHALVPAGEHIFWSKAENVTAMPANLEAGKTYYVKVKILPGLGKARVRLEMISEAEGQKALKKTKKLSTPTEEGITEGAVRVEKYIELARERAAKPADADDGE